MTLGMANGPEDSLWFDLRLTPLFRHWHGKLIIKWPGLERSWSRWASQNNHFSIEAILDESLLTERMPDWREIVLSWDQLHRIPKSWNAALRQWRGIYFIFDVRQKKGYVGAAYGDDNIHGRWIGYAKTGHGGNRKLRTLNPKNFRFSILERVSPDTPSDEVIKREGEWKTRLHTRDSGLNDN